MSFSLKSSIYYRLTLSPTYFGLLAEEGETLIEKGYTSMLYTFLSLLLYLDFQLVLS
jgi:hypothetical protein